MKGEAHDMVMRCFRHQHPEAYGRATPAEATGLPANVRYGAGNVAISGPSISQEAMGDPDAVPLDPPPLTSGEAYC